MLTYFSGCGGAFVKYSMQSEHITLISKPSISASAIESLLFVDLDEMASLQIVHCFKMFLVS